MAPYIPATLAEHMTAAERRRNLRKKLLVVAYFVVFLAIDTVLLWPSP